MPLKLFEFHFDHFLINLTQFEKTVSIGKFLTQLENVKIKIQFRN